MIPLVIDRMEDGVAICEDEARRLYSFPLSALPPGVGEGDALDYFEEENRLVPNPARTRLLRQQVLEKSRSLWED